MQSILATFNHSKFFKVRELLHELKHKDNIKVERVIYGQLFEDMTVCLLTTQPEIPIIVEKLLTNNIKIFPYNDLYRNIVKEVSQKIHSTRVVYYNESNEQTNTVMAKQSLKESSKVDPKFAKLLDKIEMPQNSNVSIIDKYNETGNYKAISNIIGSNSSLNGYAKEKFIPSVKNCIQLTLANGLENRSQVDEAIKKLKEIITDKGIKSIVTEDLATAAGHALLILCTEQDPEELINIINLLNAQQRVNVMAAARLSELIFKEKEVDLELLKISIQKVNVRFLMLCMDTVEALVPEETIVKVNKLLGAIRQYKESN